MSSPSNPPAFPVPAYITDTRRRDGGQHPRLPITCEGGMDLRDWFATHAPEPHWRFMQDSKPKHYSPGEGQQWSDSDCNAAYEAEAAWELARDTAWRFYWADAMLAERERAR